MRREKTDQTDYAFDPEIETRQCVDDGVWFDEEGVAYSRDGDILTMAQGCRSDRYEVKSGAVMICDHAFSEATYCERDYIEEYILPEHNSSWDCKDLKSVVIPDGMLIIGNGAFFKCYSLESINIPDTVVRLGDWAFAATISLKSIRLPESILRIGEHVFFNSGIEEILIPAGTMDKFRELLPGNEHLLKEEI